MRKLLLSLILLLITISSVQAQEIKIEKVSGKHTIMQGDREISMIELRSILESNEKSLKLLKSARSTATISLLLAGTGGGLVGFPVGTAIGGGDANWTLAAVGAGIILVSIPIAKSADKKIIKAVDIYNEELNATARNQFNPALNLIHNRNGIGFRVQF